MSDTRNRLLDDIKSAMKNGDKTRLLTLRGISAAAKQKEVDERVEVDDDAMLVILDKLLKQRRESIAQYQQAGRTDLADVEIAEAAIIQEYLPEALSDDDIASIVDKAIADSGAASIKDMGKVMGVVKPQMQGRADMGKVSGLIKSKLSA
jgi:uncharacterized protein